MLMKNIGSNFTVWFLLRQLKVALYLLDANRNDARAALHG